jgi:hypothetical protein
MPFEDVLATYFETLDRSIECLSHGREGELAKLPNWILKTRKISVGVTEDGKGVAMRAAPDPRLTRDTVNTITIRSLADVNQVIARLTWEGAMPNAVFIARGNNPLIPRDFEAPGMAAVGNRLSIESVDETGMSSRETPPPLHGVQVVAGSNPVAPTKIINGLEE